MSHWLWALGAHISSLISFQWKAGDVVKTPESRGREVRSNMKKEKFSLWQLFSVTLVQTCKFKTSIFKEKCYYFLVFVQFPQSCTLDSLRMSYWTDNGLFHRSAPLSKTIIITAGEKSNGPRAGFTSPGVCPHTTSAQLSVWRFEVLVDAGLQFTLDDKSTLPPLRLRCSRSHLEVADSMNGILAQRLHCEARESS